MRLDETLQTVLDQNDWTLESEGKQHFLRIGKQRVRYYDYPREDYALAVRRMILRNTLAELETVMPVELNPGRDLSVVELQRMVQALAQDTEHTPTVITKQALAVCKFKLGGALLLQALDDLISGANFESVELMYQHGRQCVEEAQAIAEFANLHIMGKSPISSAHAPQKLADNILAITDVRKPVTPLITSWYKKIADIKQEMQERALSLVPDNFAEPAATAFRSFVSACESLLEARRNEPEYVRALATTASCYETLKQACPTNNRILEASHDIYWMARVREPLSQLKSQSQVIPHA